MIQAEKPKRGRKAVVQRKRTTAFLICRAKNREKSDILLDRNYLRLSLDLGKEPDTAPSYGAVSFFVSTKSGCFP